MRTPSIIKQPFGLKHGELVRLAAALPPALSATLSVAPTHAAAPAAGPAAAAPAASPPFASPTPASPLPRPRPPCPLPPPHPRLRGGGGMVVAADAAADVGGLGCVVLVGGVADGTAREVSRAAARCRAPSLPTVAAAAAAGTNVGRRRRRTLRGRTVERGKPMNVQ